MGFCPFLSCQISEIRSEVAFLIVGVSANLPLRTEFKGDFILMMKNKSAWLMALLLCLAWGATFLSKDSIDGWARGIRVEGPNWIAGNALSLSLPILVLTAFVLWLQRDNVRRTLATIAATSSLLFCMMNAQAIFWCLIKMIILITRQPGLFSAFGPELMLFTVFACIAFTLSALCLWLCVRAASPHQPRPLASWRDWINWHTPVTRQSEGSNA